MTDAPTLETSALHLCRALHIETSGRLSWPVAVGTVAHRLKKPAGELHDAIYFAKMNGWLGTGGVPVHSLVLTSAGQVATARAKARPRQSRSSGRRAA
jgi:hypothetical protein